MAVGVETVCVGVVLAPELADAGVVGVDVVVDEAVVHGCDSAKRHIV